MIDKCLSKHCRSFAAQINMAFNFKHQHLVTPNPPGVDLTGQTIIITGSNQGIGLESARQLLVYKVSMVILAVRNTSKAKQPEHSF
jgi:hypothetical protein